MTRRAFNLSEEQERFVHDQVESGAFPDADAVVSAALNLLADDAELEAEKEAWFETLIREGEEDFAAGRFVEVEDVGAWLATLGRDEAGA